MNARLPHVPLRRDFGLATAIALAIMVVMLWLYAPAIPMLGFRDGDDALRLVQVRDLISGQGWFDTTQYRINPPSGGLMHWSRLIDAQIAALILILRPLLGTALAEQWALALYPPLLLLPLFLLLAIILRQLSDDRAVVAVGLGIAATTVTFLHYFVPLRIDHHNWQTILSVAMLSVALGPPDRRRGLLAGAIMALYLSISLEALPYLLIFATVFAFSWLRDGRAGERLLAFVGVLATGAPLLMLVTRGWSGVSADWCDAWSRPYALGAATAGVLLILGALSPRVRTDWRARLALLALSAAGGASVFLFTAPTCLAGPFGTLEPMVRDYWYVNVLEGRPLWRQEAAQAALLLAPSLAALALTATIWRRTAPGPARARWATLLIVLSASVLLSLLVARTTAVTHVYALPAFAVTGVTLWRHGRSRSGALARVTGSLAVLLVLPAVIGSVAATAVASVAEGSDTKPEGAPCPAASDLVQLARQARGLVLSGIDIGPVILVHTPHRVVATGHHRNHAAMNRAILAFAAESDAQARVAATGADYIFMCSTHPEMTNIAQNYPRGLAARLATDDTPSWLEPIAMPARSNARLYRVRSTVQAGRKESAAPFMQ